MNARNEQREQAAIKFMAWLQRFSPDAYAAVVSKVGDPPTKGIYAMADSWNLSQFPGEDAYVERSTSTNGAFDWATDALDFAKQAIPAYFQYKTQSDIMEMNIARAQQGLDPIDPGVVAPQVKVIHDVPLEYRQVVQSAGLNIQRVLLWGGIALAGFFVFRAL